MNILKNEGRLPRDGRRRHGSMKSLDMSCRFGLACLAAAALVGSGGASAQTIDNPPLLPQDITVFPERDFTSIAGFSANADLLVQVRRNGVVSDAVGRTNASGVLEVNHPGGVCWRNVTPDIGPGDTVRATYRDTSNNRTVVPALIGSGGATNSQNVAAVQAVDMGDGTVVIRGTALLSNGNRIPLNRLEVRIVNPGFIDPPASRIGKRDIRADALGGRVDGIDGNPIPGTSGTLAYDGTTANFIAVFGGLNVDERQRAVEGQTRAMAWQQTTPAGDRLGMTIYEVGEFGGPGFGGCPSGPGGTVPSMSPTPPVHYVPSYLLKASVAANQSLLKDVVVFPERDFVSIAGFAAGSELQVVVRRGVSSKPVIGTARGVVPNGGIFEVNHPGGVCWTGQTPDIRGGDVVDVFQIVNMGFSAGQQQEVIDTRVTRAAFVTSGGELRVNGVASDASGAPFPLGRMEQRIINPDFNTTRIGRRDIRADTGGGRVQNVPGGTGQLSRVGGTSSSEWRAVYTGLNDLEKQIAVSGQSRAMAWLATNGNGDRFGLTISEFGEVGGPGMSSCPAPGGASIAIP